MESETKKIRQHLGSFLKIQTVSNVEIYFKTGIDPTRISKLSNPNKDTITAKEFYKIALAVKADIDDMASHIYQEYTLLPAESQNRNTILTKFGKYLNEGLILQKTVAERTDISKSKLSTLANDEKSIPLAKEVYLIALALKKKPGDAFRLICSDVELNSSEEQDFLRRKYKGNSK